MSGQPIEAGDVRRGDILLIDGRQATVVAVTACRFFDAGGRLADGFAIHWTARGSCGVLRRRGCELLSRAARRP